MLWNYFNVVRAAVHDAFWLFGCLAFGRGLMSNIHSHWSRGGFVGGSCDELVYMFRLALSLTSVSLSLTSVSLSLSPSPLSLSLSLSFFSLSLSFFLQVKTGPFAEHSNQLWNISGVAEWTKVNSGLIKMFKDEVKLHTHTHTHTHTCVQVTRIYHTH